jgi:hypothetical protein
MEKYDGKDMYINSRIHDVNRLYLHDTSATNSDADSTRASDASSSGVKDNQALAVIVSNYARCTQNANQLIALQKWVTDSKAIIEESNKKAKK